MKNQTTLTENSKEITMTPSLLTKAQFIAMQTTFKQTVNDPQHRPRYCKTYGTKYAGTLRFEHFIAYALFRGKDLSKVTHNPKSEHFTSIITSLLALSGTSSDYRNRVIRPSDSYSPLSASNIAECLGMNEDTFKVLLARHSDVLQQYSNV